MASACALLALSAKPQTRIMSVFFIGFLFVLAFGYLTYWVECSRYATNTGATSCVIKDCAINAEAESSFMRIRVWSAIANPVRKESTLTLLRNSR